MTFIRAPPTQKLAQLQRRLFVLMERRGDPYEGLRILAGRAQQGTGLAPLMKFLRTRDLHVLNSLYFIASLTELDPNPTNYGGIHDWYVALPRVPHSAERFLCSVTHQSDREILSDIIERRGYWRGIKETGRTIQEFIKEHGGDVNEVLFLLKNKQHPKTRLCDRAENLEAALGDYLCFVASPGENVDRYLPLKLRETILYEAKGGTSGELILPEVFDKEKGGFGRKEIKEWLKFRVEYKVKSIPYRETAGGIIIKEIVDTLIESGEDKLPFFKGLPFSPYSFYRMTDYDFEEYVKTFAEKFNNRLCSQLLEVMRLRSVPGMNKELVKLKYRLNFRGGKLYGTDSTGSGPNEEACKAAKAFLNASSYEKISEAEKELYNKTHHEWRIFPVSVEGPRLDQISIGDKSLGDPITQPELFSGFGYAYPTRMSGYISRKKSGELFVNTFKSISPEIDVWFSSIRRQIY